MAANEMSIDALVILLDQMSSKKAKNVKKAWNARSVYLPGNLHNCVDPEFKRLEFELSEADVDSFWKTRDFYPVLVSLGLDALEDILVGDLKDRLTE